MSETYTAGIQEQARTGGVMLVAISFLAAVLVIAGLIYGTGTGQRHKAALAAAGCEPNLSPSGLQCTTYQVLTKRYLSITAPASQQLKTDEAAYAASEWHHLAAAKAALRAEVTSESALDTGLTGFPFPPAIAAMAKALIRANRARAVLTAEQARSSSLAGLRSFNDRVQVAGAAVQADLQLLRKALDTPPAVNQEP